MSERRYQRSPLAVWRATGSFLVAAVRPAPPRKITGSAALVWAALADATGIDELVVKLAGATDSADEAIRADVLPASRLPKVIEAWEEPRHEAFKGRNGWSLLNAFTSALHTLQERNPADLARRTMRLHALLSSLATPSMAS